MSITFDNKEHYEAFRIQPLPDPVGYYKVEYMRVRINAVQKPRWFTRLMMRLCFQAVWVDV